MDHRSLSYTHFEKLPVRRPVDRLAYISDLCAGARVLDLGCLDETALIKKDTQHWLHSRIFAVAREVLGVDSSRLVPAEGLATAPNARILHADATDPDPALLDGYSPEVIVAGEFIEHLPDSSTFLRNIKKHYTGRTLILSTPNGCSISNLLLGLASREVQHPDHLHNYTFKTLHTMCLRAGFEQWDIIPYRFFATQMILSSTGVRHAAAIVAEKSIRAFERFFPALSFGYIVAVKI